MLLSTTTCRPLAKDIPLEDVVKYTKASGFDAMDFNFCLKGFRGEETESEAFTQMLLRFKGLCRDYGLVLNQAHAPFIKAVREDVIRSMRQAALLGIKTIVVHPLQHLRYEDPGVPQQLFDLNMEYYSSLIPYCEELGIRIAVENMWQRSKKNQKIILSVCAKAEEFVQYMDALDKTWFTACLDIGHAILCDDPARAIRLLGHDRLGALHIHDSDGFDDSHTVPFHGIGKWEEITKALHDIDYTGDLTFETVDFERDMPAEAFPQTMALLGAVGKKLRSMVQQPKEG